MSEAEKMLIGRFYRDFYIFLILLLSMILICAMLVIFYCVNFKKIAIGFKVGVPIAGAVLIVISCFLGSIFSKYHKDYEYLKANDPIQIEGQVIGYSVVTSSGDDYTVDKSWPIILINKANAEISLNIIKSEERLKLYQDYEFIYLPNTKIAEIVNAVGSE